MGTKLLNVLQGSDFKKCTTTDGAKKNRGEHAIENCQPVSKFMPKCGLIMLHKDLLKMKEAEREREK